VTARRRIDEGVRHRQPVQEREVRRIQGERFIDRNDHAVPECCDRGHGSVFRKIASHGLVDFIDLNR